MHFLLFYNTTLRQIGTKSMDGTATDSPLPDEALNAHQRETRKLVRAMMALTGQSASGLALAAGLTPSTVNRFMHKPVRHTLSQRTMLALLTETFLTLKSRSPSEWDRRALADLIPALSVYEHGIVELAPDVATVITQARAAAGPQSGISHFTAEPGPTPNLPVLLVSSQGVDVNEGNFDAAPMRTQRPPYLWSDPLAFAILMPDDTLMPRYDAGDMLYASPAAALDGPKIDVVLARSGGGFVIAQLVAVTAHSIAVGTLYPLANEFYDRSKISGAYRILGCQRLQ
ncbi:MAG: hypothetical protein RIB43_17210 [Rhodospirillaceae bacterium]